MGTQMDLVQLVLYSKGMERVQDAMINYCSGRRGTFWTIRKVKQLSPPLHARAPPPLPGEHDLKQRGTLNKQAGQAGQGTRGNEEASHHPDLRYLVGKQYLRHCILDIIVEKV